MALETRHMAVSGHQSVARLLRMSARVAAVPLMTPPARRCGHTAACRLSPSRQHSSSLSARALQTAWARHYSSSSTGSSPSAAAAVAASAAASPAEPARSLPSEGSTEPVHREVPSYDLTFTCRPCKTRSTHRVSKQGYHKGTVLITCPQCKNRHLIADHLKIFADKSMTIDRLLEEQGEVVKRGTLGPDGDIEIWDQNTDDPSTGGHVGAPWPGGKTPEGRETSDSSG